jgi:hypothetical protein
VMPTPASVRALDGLRDLSTMEWYAIPMLAVVFYIYTTEMKAARRSGNWDAIYAGLTLFGMDFINETWNGWVFHLTQRSALWTAPGPSALRTMVGWNLEIMFMFAISGIVFYHSLSDDPKAKILGLPNRWAIAIGYSVLSVAIEVALNMGGHLVWEYPFWNRSFGGVWLIFLFGYFHFYVAVIGVLALKSHRNRIIAVSVMYGLALVANTMALGVWGWVY